MRRFGDLTMKLHRSTDEAAFDADSPALAPGKRSMTEGLAPVPKQDHALAPVQLMPAVQAKPVQAKDDPFGVHLGAGANEPTWVKRAREYHQDNPTYVKMFKAATNNACVGADGELDPNEVARWQVKHGLKPDGICGPDTAHLAEAKLHGDERETPAPAAAPAASAAPAAPVAENAPLPPKQPVFDPADAMKVVKAVGGGILGAIDSVLDMFTGGDKADKGAAGNAAAKPAAQKGADHDSPAPTPSPAPSQAPTDAPKADHGPVHQGDIGELTDGTLKDLAMKSENPAVKEIAADLAGLSETFQKFHKKDKGKGEESGKARDQYVADIGTVRHKIAALKGEAAFKAAAYKLIASIGTYYSQSTNIDILETPPVGDTRTCNITSLSMALEGLGISAESYKGSHDKVTAAAKMYSHKITGDAVSKAGAVDAVNGQGVAWSQLAGMRLPDFMELAAIARSMPDTSDDGVKAGAKEAWDSILSIYTLKDLASKFGASGSVIAFDATGAKHVKKNTKKGIAGQESDLDVLSGFSSGHRKDVEKYINAKNKGDEKEIAKYQGGYDAAMNDDSIDDRLSIETYRDYVIEHIGADLAKGGSIVISLAGHYAKLQAIVADGIIVNDPARSTRAATHLSWKEARAMGYFKHRLVLT
jgi:hypothetical protein